MDEEIKEKVVRDMFADYYFESATYEEAVERTQEHFSDLVETVAEKVRRDWVENQGV